MKKAKKKSESFAASYRRVLMPSDFSKFGDEAIHMVRALVGAGGQVRLLHVLEPVDLVAGAEGLVARYYNPEHTQRRLRFARRHLERLAHSLKDIQCDFKVLQEPSAALAIANEAKRWKAEIICMSTHGRSGFSRLLFGSVAQKVAAYFKGPVLLWRPSC